MSLSTAFPCVVMAICVGLACGAPVGKTAPAASARSLCLHIDAVLSAVTHARLNACALADDYNDFYFDRFQIDISYPGPNSVPACPPVLDPTSQQAEANLWKYRLSYQAGVMGINVRQGYLAKTINLEKNISASGSTKDSFLPRLSTVAKSSESVLEELENLTSSLPGFTVQQLDAEKDLCDPDAPRPDGNWPPSADQYAIKEEYLMWSWAFSMGALEANCLTLTELYDSLMLGLDSVCPKAIASESP